MTCRFNHNRPPHRFAKECGHELHGPEGYADTAGVWCACGFRGPVFYLEPSELKLKQKERAAQPEVDRGETFDEWWEQHGKNIKWRERADIARTAWNAALKNRAPTQESATCLSSDRAPNILCTCGRMMYPKYECPVCDRDGP